MQRLQNQAARIIAGVSYETRSVDVLRALEWKNLNSRRHILEATILYKILNDAFAPNLKELLISRNYLQTINEPRNSSTDLALPKPRRDFLKKSFEYRGTKLWNNLPHEAKAAQWIYSFRNIVQQINPQWTITLYYRTHQYCFLHPHSV